MRVWLGRLEYWVRPARRDPWGGPFNAQVRRQQLFEDLAGQVAFGAVVETGTHHGTTAAHLHQVTGAPVHSFELDARRYGFAATRLRSLPAVSLHLGDSRAGIAALDPTTEPTFFYLDAHDERHELPLLEELDLAFARWPRAVVMIDDFAVPDDPGYGFDEHHTVGALTLDLLGSRAMPPTAVWFPASPGDDETGYRRGCVVLAREPSLVGRIDAVPSLRRWAVAPPPTAEPGSASAAR